MTALQQRVPVDYGVAPLGTIRFLTVPLNACGPWYMTEIISHDRTFSEWIALIKSWGTDAPLPEKYDTPLSSGNPFTTRRAASVFLTELLAKELRLRWIARKFIARLRERVYARRIIGADCDLYTTEPVRSYAAVKVRDRLSRCMYVFDVKTATTLIRSGLNYSNFGIACPLAPKNPYTNKPWSTTQLMVICSQVLAYTHLSLRTVHPADIYEFRLCGHNVSQYFLKHAERLQLSGARAFFAEVHNTDLNEIRKELIDDFYDTLGHDICHGWRTVRAFAVERLLPTELEKRWDTLLCSYWIYVNFNKTVNFESFDRMLEEFSHLHDESYKWWCTQSRRILRRPAAPVVSLASSDNDDSSDSV